MLRRAFSLLEIVIVIGVLSAVSALSIPAYRDFQIRSDLDTVTQQVAQGLARAQLLSKSGEQDAAWGFYVPDGTLYKGESYVTRDQDFDQTYPMPSTIAVTGLLDVSYARLSGLPSEEGNIVLRALNDDSRTIRVSISVDSQTIATNTTDLLTICHLAGTASQQTITVPDATWPTHQAHGDTIGACAGASSAASSVASSAASSAASSVASSAASSAASSVALSSCGIIYYPATQKVAPYSGDFNVSFINYVARINYGTQSNPPLTSGNGPQINVYACYAEAAGASADSDDWKAVWGGNGICTDSSNGNSNGNALPYSSSSSQSAVEIDSDKNFFYKVVGRYKSRGYLAFNEYFNSADGTSHVKFLRNGDSLPSSSCLSGSCAALAAKLASLGKWSRATQQVSINSCQILAVTELETIAGSLSDYDDDVMLMTFAP